MHEQSKNQRSIFGNPNPIPVDPNAKDELEEYCKVLGNSFRQFQLTGVRIVVNPVNWDDLRIIHVHAFYDHGRESHVWVVPKKLNTRANVDHRQLGAAFVPWGEVNNTSLESLFKETAKDLDESKRPFQYVYYADDIDTRQQERSRDIAKHILSLPLVEINIMNGADIKKEREEAKKKAREDAGIPEEETRLEQSSRGPVNMEVNPPHYRMTADFASNNFIHPNAIKVNRRDVVLKLESQPYPDNRRKKQLHWDLVASVSCYLDLKFVGLPDRPYMPQLIITNIENVHFDAKCETAVWALVRRFLADGLWRYLLLHREGSKSSARHANILSLAKDPSLPAKFKAEMADIYRGDGDLSKEEIAVKNRALLAFIDSLLGEQIEVHLDIDDAWMGDPRSFYQAFDRDNYMLRFERNFQPPVSVRDHMSPLVGPTDMILHGYYKRKGPEYSGVRMLDTRNVDYLSCLESMTTDNGHFETMRIVADKGDDERFRGQYSHTEPRHESLKDFPLRQWEDEPLIDPLDQENVLNKYGAINNMDLVLTGYKRRINILPDGINTVAQRGEYEFQGFTGARMELRWAPILRTADKILATWPGRTK